MGELLTGKTILLVEDDAWLAEVESDVLRAAGGTVVVAPHAMAAIDEVDNVVAAGAGFDVIILDVLLTGSTAFSLLNELQSHGDTAGIPIVLCTNLAEQFSSSSLQQYGVQRVVDKTTMHPGDMVAAVLAVTSAETNNADEGAHENSTH